MSAAVYAKHKRREQLEKRLKREIAARIRAERELGEFYDFVIRRERKKEAARGGKG